MGTHRRHSAAGPAYSGAPARGVGYLIRSSRILPTLAFLAATALVAVPMIDPSNAFAMTAEQSFVDQYGVRDAQTLLVGAGDGTDVDRPDYKITVAPAEVEKAEAEAPAVGKPDPGSAKAIALDLVEKKGWGDKHFACLVALWNRESHWNVYASNGGSGAYGIPQAVPGSKMGSVGSNWRTSATTQITWGLGYIAGRYGTPCAAWAHSQNSGWY
ncbi:lytic transglycosylase domain-containing protein [Galbitalea sp. SE-J8]|uniref:aggregation-promoting factor C-terminal-like domain-containing protein n=1 Tax=Galbitalea sp. SE-J8 TaxID=3054952 RepID=UPI00259C71B8|nr:lytic transglycosylase domain-containing protein [Galbitalea sp. SE-J8]MDM4762882.1 lytic transglycosylase domain-containing protein [Galbitalea sp. SE-J8]